MLHLAQRDYRLEGYSPDVGCSRRFDLQRCEARADRAEAPRLFTQRVANELGRQASRGDETYLVVNRALASCVRHGTFAASNAVASVILR